MTFLLRVSSQQKYSSKLRLTSEISKTPINHINCARAACLVSSRSQRNVSLSYHTESTRTRNLHRNRSQGVVEDRCGPGRAGFPSRPVRPEPTRHIKRPSRRLLGALLRFPLPKDPLFLQQHARHSRKYLSRHPALIKSLI